MESVLGEETVINYDEDTATMGDRIEAARHTKELSRDELARRLGVKKSTIRKWENDQSEPRSNRLYMLSGVLDCNVMWLLNGEGDTPLEHATLDAENKLKLLRAELRDLRESLDRVSARIGAIENQL